MGDSWANVEGSKYYNPGIRQLCEDIQSYWNSVRPEPTLRPADYLQCSPDELEVFKLPIRRFGYSTAEYAGLVLAFWLGAPMARHHAQFVHQLITRADIGLLVLPDTFAVCKSVSSQVLGLGRNATPLESRIVAWGREKLANHSVCQPDSEVAGLVAEIYEKVKAGSSSNGWLEEQSKNVSRKGDLSVS